MVAAHSPRGTRICDISLGAALGCAWPGASVKTGRGRELIGNGFAKGCEGENGTAVGVRFAKPGTAAVAE
jgi:hypothetical protein